MNNTRKMERNHFIYRYNNLVSSIEYVGGFALLSQKEQDEYNRLREYFRIYNQLIKTDMSETDAHDIACAFIEHVL
jgi:hypothetical protein